MKILLVTGNYLPGKNGGIENYTHWLAITLLRHGYQVEVAALSLNTPGNYVYEDVKVNKLNRGLSSFEDLLKIGGFQICHFHEYSEDGGIEIPWFKKAREYCQKVFFTFHLPYLTCYKLDFRYKGISDCNTFTDPERCTKCVIADKLGYKNFRSDIILNAVLGFLTLKGSAKKLQGRIAAKNRQLNELISTTDNIFIYADWFKNILSENGYNIPSIKKIPYKTKTETGIKEALPEDTVKNKILFVGRIQHQKGLHLLCNAMNDINEKNIQLDVYGNIVDQDYFDKCMNAYAFNFKGTTSHFELQKLLKEYDFLVLPSVFTEMYSMIIKDAFYEQLPVIASTAKGNKDAVTDGSNGFLFEYDNAKDLSVTIDRAYQLKKKGWKPTFSYPENPENDIAEILSYYC